MSKPLQDAVVYSYYGLCRRCFRRYRRCQCPVQPLTEEVKIVAAPASKDVADTDTIRKRADTSCQENSFNATALDWANKDLVEKSNSKQYNKGEWGWV
jgi:hypothetical protein